MPLRQPFRLVVLSALTLLVVVPSAAVAAPVLSTWTRVSEAPGAPTDVPGVARDATGALHVAYVTERAVNNVALRHRVMTTRGKWLLPSTIETGWNLLTAPDLEAAGGGVFAFYAGRSAAVADPAVPTTLGHAWSAQFERNSWRRLPIPTTVATTPAASAQLSSTTDGSGNPFLAWTNSTLLGVHAGFATSGPEIAAETACCELGTNIGRDMSSNEVYTVTRSTAPGTPGVSMRMVSPASAAPVTLRDSAKGGSSIARATRLAAVSRPNGGGVYTAYCASFPTCNRLRVANQRDRGIQLDLKVPARPESVWVAPGPGGRLWLTWTDTRRAVWGARSNAAFTRWGTPVQVAAPPGTTNTWHAEGDGERGALDLVLNATVNGATHLWHTRIVPGLTLAPVKPVPAGRMNVVRVQVTDAGDPVRAAVTFRGARRLTTANGLATLIVPPDTPPGRYALEATSTGFAPHTGTLVVTR